MARAQALWRMYVHTVGAVDRQVNTTLGNFGAFVARKPVPVLVTSLLVSLLLSLGLIRIPGLIESNAERLWYGPAAAFISATPAADATLACTLS